MESVGSPSEKGEMIVALCQIPMCLTIRDNAKNIVEAIRTSRADLAVFPECALTGYHHVMGGDISRHKLDLAYSEICSACKESGTAAIIGAPWYDKEDQEKPWNAAVVIDHQGNILTVQPKIVFTDDEIRNDIFLPAALETRRPFRLQDRNCAILICAEFAGVVGSYTSSHCYRLLEGLKTELDLIVVIGVMDMSPSSKGSPLSAEVATHFGADIVIVNTPEWGFGTPTGNLGGSKVVSRDGQLLIQAPFDEVAITTVELGLGQAKH